MRDLIIEKMYEWSKKPYQKFFKKNEPWNITPKDLILLPNDSLGFHMGCFLLKYNFEMQPKLEDHDVIHVLTNTGISVVEEIGMQYYLFGNGKKSAYLFMVIFVGTIFYPNRLKTFYKYYKRGQNAHQFYHLPLTKCFTNRSEKFNSLLIFDNMNFALKLYHQDKKVNQTLFLYIIYCFSLLLVRAKITQSVYLFFLIWNLFLAFVPYVISSYFKSLDAKNKSKLKRYAVLIIWLLFIPNSFYIITDLVHLDNSDGIFFWLDLIIISSYALIGFGLGLLSLTHFEKTLKTIISKKYVSITLFCISFLCGFGIYVGRILRYNSWDVISNPFDLIVDLFIAATSKTSLFFSVQFGIFIYLAFLIKKNITSK